MNNSIKVSDSIYHRTNISLCSIVMLLLLCCTSYAQKERSKNICSFLGGRADKNFLGSGNLAVVAEQTKSRVLFVQQWKEKGLFDWAAGTVKSWYPDRMEMKDAAPEIGAEFTHAPAARTAFITRDDVAGIHLIWKNSTTKTVNVIASFSGQLPGSVRKSIDSNGGLLHATSAYSNKVSQPVYYSLGSPLEPSQVELKDSSYKISFEFLIKTGEQKSITLMLGIGTDPDNINKSVKHWKNQKDILEANRNHWNSWFHYHIPQFTSSNPFFEKLYYYRWWSLYTKMIFAKVGRFYHAAPREGTVAYEGVVSYSGACISVDELRWMRNPDWALSTTKEFFAPENLNDGYLSNHIWDWGIDADESNMDALGRSVPYHNYAIDAFRGALLLHPENASTTLKEIWPRLRSNLESYIRLFDIDRDHLYETYPWSNSAGQEWSARYFYFDPIPEIFRNERSRTYAPDGSRAEEDMQLMEKIRNTVVTDPELHWPKNAEELYRIYYATGDHRLATVDQTTYAWKNFEAAAQLARKLNDDEAEKQYREISGRIRRQLLSVMWNENDAFFYDVKPVVHKHAKVKSTTGFYPFWARIAGREHLPMLKHVFDPSTFWTNYPLPSLALSYEKYKSLQESGWTYWNYATWPRTTCHVADGVLWASKTLDTSLQKNASTLFDRYTRMHFPDEDIRRPNIAERYDPHTGAPFMEYLDYNHSSWIDLLMQHVAGITPADSDTLTIDPVDMGWDYFAVKNIRYRNHDIDIEYSRKNGMILHVDGKLKSRTRRLQKTKIKL